MERAIPADKVVSAPESPLFTSSVGDLETEAEIFAGALDLRKRGIAEADCQVKIDRDVTVTASSGCRDLRVAPSLCTERWLFHESGNSFIAPASRLA